MAEGYGEERLSEWMFHWEAAERTLLTAVACGLTREALNRMVFGPIQERVYADGGHALDLSNKAFELLEFIGREYATEVSATHCGTPNRVAVRGRTGNMAGTGRNLVELIRAAEEALRKNPPRTRRGRCRRLELGVPAVELARHLTLAAAWRLARFAESNDIEDWFAPDAHFFVLQRASSGAGTG